jgi:hypothetical protein
VPHASGDSFLVFTCPSHHTIMAGNTFQGNDLNISNPFAWLCSQPEGLLRLNFTPDVAESQLIPTDPFNKKPSSERTETARSSRQAAQDKYRSLALVQLGNGHEREKSHFVVMSLLAPSPVRDALNRNPAQWQSLVHIMQPVALRSDGHLSESIILEPNPTGSSSNRDVIVYVRDLNPDGSVNLWLHNEGWLKLTDVQKHIEEALMQCHGLGPLLPGTVIFLLQRKSLPLSKSIGNQQYRFCVTLPTCTPQHHAGPSEPRERWGFAQACTAHGIALVCNVTGADWTAVAAKYSCHDPVTYHPSLVWPNLVSAFPGLAHLSVVPPAPSAHYGMSVTRGMHFHTAAASRPVVSTGKAHSNIPSSNLDSQIFSAPLTARNGQDPVMLSNNFVSGPMTGSGFNPPTVLPGGFFGRHIITAFPPPVSSAPEASPTAFSSKRSRDSSEEESVAPYLEHLPDQAGKRPRTPRRPA